MSTLQQSDTTSRITWMNAPTMSVDVFGTRFVYRELGDEWCAGRRHCIQAPHDLDNRPAPDASLVTHARPGKVGGGTTR